MDGINGSYYKIRFKETLKIKKTKIEIDDNVIKKIRNCLHLRRGNQK